MSAPSVSELIAWIRSQTVKDRARAEKEAAATSVTDCLNADHDPKDVLAAADMHEALLDFIETNFRSTIELDATTSGAELVGDLFWTMKGEHPARSRRQRLSSPPRLRPDGCLSRRRGNEGDVAAEPERG